MKNRNTYISHDANNTLNWRTIVRPADRGQLLGIVPLSPLRICFVGITFFSCIFLGVLPAMAQQKEEVAIELTGTPFGFYLKMKNPVPSGYEVLRKEKGKDFIVIGSYKPVFSSSDLFRRMADFASIFPNFGRASKAFADTIWTRYQGDKSALSQVPYPLMQLSLGNAYIDTSAVLGKTYQYRVVLEDSGKTLETLATVYQSDRPQYSKMLLSSVKNVGKSVRLEWTASVINTPPFFEVYRKQSGGKDQFRKINVERGTHTNDVGDSTVFIAVDTTGTIGITYDYFLASVGYLGNEGNHSDSVRLQLGGRQNVPSIYNLRTRSDSNGICLSWHGLVPNPSLNNILVIRSESYDTGYALLATLPVGETRYIDRNVEGGKLYYYQLVVQGAANYSIPTPRVSGKFMGKIQLAPPHDLRSNALTGGVALSWQYRDMDRVKGFKVFRSLNPRRDFEFIGEMVPAPEDTSFIAFTDTTVANENTTYYYAVAAVSRTSNLSPSSLVVSGQAKNKSTLLAPTGLRSLWLNDSVVSITWRDMELQVSGVLGYKIYRNEEALNVVSNQYLYDSVLINEFKDTLHVGDTRWYWVKAEDAQGQLGSTSAPIRVSASIDRPLPPGMVRVYEQESAVTLQWDFSLDTAIERYNIYRAENTGNISLLASVKADQEILSYSDKAVRSGRIYFYYVASVDANGIESERSTEVHVRRR